MTRFITATTRQSLRRLRPTGGLSIARQLTTSQLCAPTLVVPRPQPVVSRFASTKKRFVPRKAAVQLTEQSRLFFRQLLAEPPRPEIIGIRLDYDQSKSGEPRMVFSFSFCTADDLGPQDEGVSLELLDDGTPKSPRDAADDGLPKLYVHGNAFLKVLGATVDVSAEGQPILYDAEGNLMDPNA